jgi:hypothetical protein
MAGDDKDLDRLFGLPLDEFTGARNELAKRLKAEKDTEAADAIRALPKPTVPAWTINQLSRVDREGIRALLEAGEALRTAQQRLLAGDDEAGNTLREATARERQAVERLTDRARAVLAEADRPATSTVLDRLATTLRAAAVSDEGRAVLEAGRLTSELEPAGFDAFAATGSPARPRRRGSRGREEQDERRREQEERRRRTELREQARMAEQAAREAEREADRAEKAAAEARRVADKARAEADAAKARAEG